MCDCLTISSAVTFFSKRIFALQQQHLPLGPTAGAYPTQIGFDSQGRVRFAEIFGKKFGVIYPALTDNNSTKGITEYETNQADLFETSGPITASNKTNNTVWFTTVDFPEGERSLCLTSIPNNLLSLT